MVKSWNNSCYNFVWRRLLSCFFRILTEDYHICLIEENVVLSHNTVVILMERSCAESESSALHTCLWQRNYVWSWPRVVTTSISAVKASALWSSLCRRSNPLLQDESLKEPRGRPALCHLPTLVIVYCDGSILSPHEIWYDGSCWWFVLPCWNNCLFVDSSQKLQLQISQRWEPILL